MKHLSKARGKALDAIAGTFGVERESRRPRWWRWWWPGFWPFVEGDATLRLRTILAVRLVWNPRKDGEHDGAER